MTDDAENPANTRASLNHVYQDVQPQLVAGVDEVQRAEILEDIPSFDFAREAMRRSQNIPPNPETRLDINDDFLWGLDAGGQNFYLGGSKANDPDRFLIFGNRRYLFRLIDMGTWYVDGTFFVAPALFRQLVTVHGFVLGQSFPLVYMLCLL